MLPYPILADALMRMLTAMLIGCIIGIDRDLHGKPTGMKTLGLVSLGACLATMCAQGFSMTLSDDADVSRAVQGIVTGVGFLGAGVILQNPRENRVRGLTTAASIWVTAAVGIVCGLGVWSVAFLAMLLMILLMVLGRVVEKRLLRRWMNKPENERKNYDDVGEI
ncbi:MgtC/SapB family protein [Caballeronia sp. LZ034LL]|uniref:MgtC/SapB family protein n=1 Tax=Caballeronia sp. LZ034LL TaxID=3038567 RepID=UPI002865E46D|nr:MgtC/SapB family protein [Caballeronia sp. LZ034LL]MDR5835104.1 MgtC/SapB family protein [Caballeronia sp. LZ034LL]